MDVQPTPGTEFLHRTMVEPGWTPSEHRLYVHGPRARARVISVDDHTVHFHVITSARPQDKATYSMPLSQFVLDYCAE